MIQGPLIECHLRKRIIFLLYKIHVYSILLKGIDFTVNNDEDNVIADTLHRGLPLYSVLLFAFSILTFDHQTARYNVLEDILKSQTLLTCLGFAQMPIWSSFFRLASKAKHTEKDSSQQEVGPSRYLFVQQSIIFFTNPLHYKQPLCPLMAQVMFCWFVPDFFRTHFP